MTTYYTAARHPWACLMFLAPLLAVYEYGVVRLGGERAESLRNGADAWLRDALGQYGNKLEPAAPLVVVLVFAAWTWWRWSDRPKDPVGTCFGMALESGFFAALLWQVSRNFSRILDEAGVALNVPGRETPVGQIVTYVGAGIYEEVIFRLGVFSIGYVLLRAALLPRPFALVLAGLGGAILFAAAHHMGPTGEPMRAYVFVFRALAGLYFTVLYVVRGFGIAVGAHAGYDVLAGVTVG